eukprot:Amastigsp_a3353_63.p3 type:complete len:104 gc:universal Amastigsp_a3353_63:776-465(-)
MGIVLVSICSARCLSVACAPCALQSRGPRLPRLRRAIRAPGLLPRGSAQARARRTRIFSEACLTFRGRLWMGTPPECLRISRASIGSASPRSSWRHTSRTRCS